MDPITLTVPGKVQSQGSKRAFVNRKTGKAILVESGGESHKAWRHAVSDAARQYLLDHPMPPLDEPVAVMITARFAQVKSDPYRVRHTTDPDGDKIGRSILDSLRDAALVTDDSRVCSLSVTKFYVAPGETAGAEIVVHPLGEIDRYDRANLRAAHKELNRRKRAGLASLSRAHP